MVDPVPVQPSAKCEACGHTDEKHITTGETDIDGRPVGGSYDYCEDCQARGDDSCVHDFKAMPVAPLCETCGKPIWQTSLGDWFHADGYEPTHRALSNKLFKPVAGRWWHGGPAPIPLEVRFWTHVDKDGPVPESRPDLGPCWLWTAAVSKDGYGFTSVNRQYVIAHRWAYEQENGPIPDGMVLDHLCRTHACVRSTHMEPVTDQVNILRGVGTAARNAAKTHCPRGHEYAGDNLLVGKGGSRFCRACRAIRVQERKAVK